MSALSIKMIDGEEFKTCATCGEQKSVQQCFYDYRDYGGVILTQCKACISKKNARRHRLKKMETAADKVTYLNRLAKERRAQILFAMVRAGEVQLDNFQAVLRGVEY